MNLSGEGNGTPFQYSCLENPMDGGAWWAAVHGVAESRTWLSAHFHFSLSCIGEGNGNPLQCSCLENPRDRGAWWAAIYGVAQSRTRLRWLSSSSSSEPFQRSSLYMWTHTLLILHPQHQYSLQPVANKGNLDCFQCSVIIKCCDKSPRIIHIISPIC